MKKSSEKSINTKTINIFIRYILILLFGLGNLTVFYNIFKPITIRAVYLILGMISETILIQNYIIFNSHIIEIIPACVAGAAYYLLLILILATPDIDLLKRLKIILISFTVLFIFNILRIILLVFTLDTIYFESIHFVFWYVISTLFVFATWIIIIKIFNRSVKNESNI